jgi:hypothetical protein
MSRYIIAFIVLVIAWMCGWVVFHVTSGLIHILLVLAVVSLILHFVRPLPLWISNCTTTD